MKRKYIIVRHIGKMNSEFKVTNPKKIAFWKAIAQSGSSYAVKTQIIEEGYEEK